MAAAAIYDSAGESIDLLQTVRHQPSSSSSSSVPTTSTAQRLPPVVLPACKVSRRHTERRVCLHGKQRAVIADIHCSRRCSDDDDDDDDDDAYVERATTRHCHCCCQRRVIHQSDVTDVEEAGGVGRLRSALDDDVDPVSYIEHDHLTTSGLYLPPLFVTSVARRTDAQPVGEAGDVATSRPMTCSRQQPTCFSRWWTEVFRRRRDVARRRHDKDDDDDDCWRLFPTRRHNRVMSRDTARRSASEPGVASLCSSPAAADDSVDVRSSSQGGDVVLLTQRCRRATSAGDKPALVDGRHRCARVFCVILGGLCVAVVGLLVGGLVISSPSSLHYSE